MARRFLVDVDLKRSLLADGSAGTSGYVLKSQGANQPPVWAVESGGAFADQDYGLITGATDGALDYGALV